jgi:glycosyltransferase involved in cell wall biosynthesis
VPTADGLPVPLISVVLPVYNERENLAPLRQRLVTVLDDAAGGAFELVFVDDGSHDGSPEIIVAWRAQDRRIKLVQLSRNFGHQAALQAGLDAARGAAVVLMDTDLQDPPEMLRAFITAWRDGHEVVYAVRRQRREGLLKRAAYATFYRTVKLIAQIDVPLDTGDFCLLDRKVVDTLVELPEHNRFLRGLRSWVGFRQVGVEYARDARHAGEPKYTLRKLIRLALSGYVGFSAMPLRVASALGLLAALLGFLLSLWTVASKLLDVASPRGWTSLMSVILLVAGSQLLVLGVIGEYLSRVYDEVRRRPLYVVRTRFGWDKNEENP